MKIKGGSCRAPARLRWRWVRRHLQCLYRRHRSLAKARQLPQGVGGGSGISVWMKIKGGSCRAPARLRWRSVRRHLQCLCRRHRSLAEARQLPQGIGGGSGNFGLDEDQRWELSSPRRGCDGGRSGDIFSACAAAIAASLKLDSSHRGLAVGPGISVWMKIKGGSCRAPARLRWRWIRR